MFFGGVLGRMARPDLSLRSVLPRVSSVQRPPASQVGQMILTVRTVRDIDDFRRVAFPVVPRADTPNGVADFKIHCYPTSVPAMVVLSNSFSRSCVLPLFASNSPSMTTRQSGYDMQFVRAADIF
jgi:hypothetical protein